MARYQYNDNLHSQLARAGRPAQRRIEAPARPPSMAHGSCRVMELASERALNDFTMGGTVRGVAWSLNPYVGCVHACAYCYVPSTTHLERNRWGSYVTVKENLPHLLRQEVKIRPRRTVYISTATDPYQAAEREHQTTRRCLEILLRHDWPIEILTRSPLVLRDLDLLKRFTRVRVGLSVPTLDERARRLLEPNAPPIRARLAALRSLADAGLPVFANYSPAYPFTNGVTAGRVAEALQAAGAQWVNTSHWRRVPTFLGPLWDRLHETEWEPLARHLANPQSQETLRGQLSVAFKRVGLPLRAGFFNPIFDLTPPYEATSQLKLERGTEPEPAVGSVSAVPILTASLADV